MTILAGCLAPLLYCLVALLPVILKWAGAPRFVAWSWWQATAFLWGPGGLLLLLAFLGWLLQLGQNRRARG
jgi:hypothetical protein